MDGSVKYAVKLHGNLTREQFEKIDEKEFIRALSSWISNVAKDKFRPGNANAEYIGNAWNFWLD